jgi:hypothetical protein
MGIERNIGLVIMREHKHRPIRGDVLLIGRQTMFFSPQDAIGMLAESGLPSRQIDFQPESRTRSSNETYISDSDFFRLLGLDRIRALDVSDYEGADIVHDLTQPLPTHLEGCADFILDGSTLDNVFDPATALRNYARLLRPGGRIVSINVASNDYDPYLILTPHWVLDYFAVNRFADCKPYILVYDLPGGINVFTPDLSSLRRDRLQPNNLTSGQSTAVVFVAEKDRDSTWDRTPVQHQYRGDWKAFNEGLARFMASSRTEPLRSTAPCFFDKDAFLYVDKDGVKRPALRSATATTNRYTKAIARMLSKLGQSRTGMRS